MRAKAVRKPAKRKIRISKLSQASEAIGQLEKDQDVYILTFGQFSLIDAICAILKQIGPADLAIATWTAANADLQRSAALIESASIRSLKMIVDGSFLTRKPDYCYHMIKLFGADCIRAIKTHAKFVLMRSDSHDIVIRTSMNLNENPRLESIEITENQQFAEFFQIIVDEIFSERPSDDYTQIMPKMDALQESFPFKEISAGIIKQEDLNEPKTTHTVKRHS